MGFEFYDCYGFAVLTTKKVRDLDGDIVWVIGRLGGTQRYFLDCRFKVDRHELFEDAAPFTYRVSGAEGLAFFPVPEITRKTWFRRLKSITSNFSVGLQVVKDPGILEGLQGEYSVALDIQSGSNSDV